jgi:hypothetical protein
MARTATGTLVTGVGVMSFVVSRFAGYGPRRFIGQWQQRIPFRIRLVPTALLAGKEHHKDAGQQQAEEYG